MNEAFPMAAMATDEGLAKILPEGRQLHPDALTYAPTGHRVLILLDEVPDEYRGIKIPDEYKDHEKMGAGRVIGVGPLVGNGQCRFPGGPLCTPEQLLYRHVIFGQYAGKPIRLDFVRDDKYMSQIIIMTEMDVWQVDWKEKL